MKKETEVKRDSEWMKEEFKKLERTGVIDSWVYRDLWMMANQLDEPEVKQIKELDSYNDELIRDNNQLRNALDNQKVLSQEWVDENSTNLPMSSPMTRWVPVSKLQNLLVPKQEELESAIKVLIEAYKQEEDAYGELENGWISGFINDLKNLVEEEPLYYVIDKSRKPLLRAFKEEVGMSVCDVTVEEAEALKHPNFKYRLTEQEIKDYDDRFWPFAKQVEELEEVEGKIKNGN